MKEQLYVCKSTSASGRVIFLAGTAVQGGELWTSWSTERESALEATKAKRDALIDDGFRGRGFGRWVRA